MRARAIRAARGCSSSPAAGRLRTRSPRARSPPFSAGRSSRTRRRGFACAAPKSGDRRARRGLLRGPRRAASAPAFSTASTSRCALRSSASGSTRTSSCRSTRGSRRSACRPRSSAPRSIDARRGAGGDEPRRARRPRPLRLVARRVGRVRGGYRAGDAARRRSSRRRRWRGWRGWRDVCGWKRLEYWRFFEWVLRRQRRARVVRRVSREARGDRRRGDARSRRRAPRHRVRGGHLRDGGRARGDRGASRVERSFHRELDADPRRRRALGAAILGERRRRRTRRRRRRGGDRARPSRRIAARAASTASSPPRRGTPRASPSPSTLLIGDVSFQHDSNGLLLLRERPGQPPVTIVVVNNGGGGIFSFLPVADQIDPGAFTKLFATPPDVSRKGLCDAHRIAHAHPSTPEGLKKALRAAWSEGRHNVVEVSTSRASNLKQHRAVQARVAAAASAALRLLEGGGGAAAAAAAKAKATPRVISAEVTDFTLPLRRPPTTTATATATADDAVRRGWLLKVVLDDGSIGWGEASPLPGLHLESHDAAGAQLRTVASIVDGSAAGGGGSGGGGVFVDATLPLLNGAVAEWLTSACGVREDALLPSVRFALETAVLSALACRSSSSGGGGGGGECNAPLASVLLLGDAGERLVAVGGGGLGELRGDQRVDSRRRARDARGRRERRETSRREGVPMPQAQGGARRGHRGRVRRREEGQGDERRRRRRRRDSMRREPTLGPQRRAHVWAPGAFYTKVFHPSPGFNI